MSNELFTDLTVEQQEVVAGGLDFAGLLNKTSFEDFKFAKEDAFKFDIASTSGPGGTTNGFSTSLTAQSLLSKLFTNGSTGINVA